MNGGSRPQACPFVAFDDDRDRRSEAPDPRHRCFAVPNPEPRAIAHQQAYCLTPNFPSCAFFMDWAGRAAAAPLAGSGAGSAPHRTGGGYGAYGPPVGKRRISSRPKRQTPVAACGRRLPRGSAIPTCARPSRRPGVVPAACPPPRRRPQAGRSRGRIRAGATAGPAGAGRAGGRSRLRPVRGCTNRRAWAGRPGTAARLARRLQPGSRGVLPVPSEAYPEDDPEAPDRRDAGAAAARPARRGGRRAPCRRSLRARRCGLRRCSPMPPAGLPALPPSWRATAAAHPHRLDPGGASGRRGTRRRAPKPGRIRVTSSDRCRTTWIPAARQSHARG